MQERFYICRKCGNLVGMINDGGVPMTCCGTKMEALVPNTAEAAGEKHKPIVKIQDKCVYVNVGEESHPMQDNHFIEWVYLHTDKGGYRRILNPADRAEVKFCIGDDKPVAVYAYCNVHGLWMTEI